MGHNGALLALYHTHRSQGGGIGVWMSPWGGYGAAQHSRTRFASSLGLCRTRVILIPLSSAQSGFETNDRGFSLAGSKYFQRFRDTCFSMIDRFDVNMFKFDGIAGGLSAQGAPPEYFEDIYGLIRLTKEIRSKKVRSTD